MEKLHINTDHHFERWSDTYERSWMQWFLFDRVHRAVLNAIPADWQPQAILDIGCGTGRLLRKVRARWPGARLVGVDPTEGMIAHARAGMPEGEFHLGTAEALPLADGSVDLVLSTVSFHHWQDQAQGVREVSRVLRPGGHFYLADAVQPVWFSKMFRHGTPVTLPQVREFFTQAGFQIRSQKPVLGRNFYLTVGEK